MLGEHPDSPDHLGVSDSLYMVACNFAVNSLGSIHKLSDISLGGDHR